jgi:hypothetical protein
LVQFAILKRISDSPRVIEDVILNRPVAGLALLSGQLTEYRAAYCFISLQPW